ncbi:uncharacterized protein LOC116129150 [Pistacia vera]|uniref:uncharacterized protein LOC116129150 n=1 Tax=Pistacia vera TaxID=55513 RepID=UPI001263943F|nr:uncharacterized protein LOC116129150 [Pistacia vera]
MAQEIAVAAGTEVVKEATSDIYGLLKQQISYVFKYQNYINDLKKQVLELRNKRQMVQKPAESAERQGEEIYELVTTWLSDVHEFTEEVAKSIIEDEDKVNKGGCFKLASCPNLIQRYRLGKKAMNATINGADLLGKGNFSHVSYRPALQRTESMYVRGYEAFDSRMQVLQEIMDTLKDVNVNMIGVYGMGGVGKTTLVKKVAWLTKENKLFDEVAVAEVTQTPDYKKIQEQIAFDLGLEFGQESEYQRAGLLRNRIKKEKNVLVIFDNIWTKVDLDAIGIPFGDAEGERNDDTIGIHLVDAERERNDDKTRRCTILLTSRRQDLLSKDMNTQKNIHVPPLSDKDAWNLFVKIVGDLAESSDFQPIATEIVKKCAGLPVAISVIANALRNESLYTWKDALTQLKKSNPRCIPGMDDTLYSTIELSYKFLKDEEAQSLFLLCALAAEGINISIADLLKYAFGWGLFQNVDTLEEGRNRLHSLINHLKGSCLLLDGDSNDHVKMHDIIHAVAVTIASSKFMFNIQNATVLEKKISKKSAAISLPYRKVSYELPKRLECPELMFFLLYTRNQSLQVPDILFEGIKEINVLVLTGIHFLSLPPSLCCLKKIRTLCLDGCMLGDVAIIGELNTLEILSFLNSDIEQLPSEIGQLTQLKLLDLSNCLKLKVIAPNVISSLSQLEELYMGNSFVQWEADGANSQGRRRNASLGELKRLSNLRALHLHIPDIRVMPQDMFFEKLNSYKILIGDKWNWSYKYDFSTSRTLKLKISANNYLGQGVRTLLKRVEDLYLNEMNGVRNVLYKLHEEGFPHLKHLLVQDGLELLYIVNSFTGKLAFPKLEALVLRHLINLEKICHGQFNAESFSKLRILKIEKCDRLKYLFASSVAKNLTQLQEMEVTDCKNLEEIFGEESKDYGDEIETDDMIEFNQLCSLTLQHLPQFIKIGSDMRVVFPRLEKLKLCSINIENTWLDQPLAMSSYSQCLKSLTVEECNGLKFLFSSSMVKSLNQLHKLVIGNCKSMEVIIDSKKEEGEERIIDMSFPKLFYLKLEVLPKLVTFGIGNSIEFPSLNELHIDGCSNLKTFFCKSIYPGTVREEPKEELNLENYFIDINPLFDEKVAFPSLEVMVLLHLDNLQLIWNSQQLHVESFCKLKKVRVKFCEKLKTIVPSNSHGLLTFHNLKELTVENCWSMRSVFPVTIATGLVQLNDLCLVSCGLEKIVSEKEVNGAPRFFFPQLTNFRLYNLPELKCFYPGFHTIEWPILKFVAVYGCKKIKIYASEFPSFQRKDDGESQPAIFLLEKVIPNLEALALDAHDFKLTFLHCDLAESFGKLKTLLLCYFDDEYVASLSGFLQRLNCLESLWFVGNSFKELFPYEQGHIWKQDLRGDTFLQNLQTLQVVSCDGLVSILTCSAAKALVNLTTTTIRDCKLVIEIIAKEGDREEEIVFGQLKVLELYCLSSLTFFCSTNYSFKFPCLEQVIVSQCPKLKIFSQGVLSTPLLKRVQLTREGDPEYFWKEDLNSTIKQMFTDMVGFRSFEHLTLSQFPNLKEKLWNGQTPIDLFWNLKSLEVDNFSDMSSAIPSNVLCGFKNLEMLDVRSCESLEQVFDLEENRQEILGLKKLKSLKIGNCNRLRYIFTPWILLGLVQLQAIEVKNCALIEVIIKKEPQKDAVSDKIVIPQLNSVVLESLPNLTSFYSGSEILECPPLETIIIKDCQKIHMKEFGIHLASLFTVKVVLPSLEAFSCFQNLTILVIDGFDHLKYLFPSSMVKSIFRLKELQISNSKFMVRIIDEDEERSSTMLFPKLYELKLRDLPKLTTFSNSTSNFVVMPSLFRLWIDNCPGVQTFISSSIFGDMTLSSKEHEETNAKENFTQMHSLFDKKVRFPSLERLQISYADELVKIWDDQISLDSFCKLNRVFVRFCKRLVSVFPSNMFGSHQKLETLIVENCDSVEEIFEVLEERSSEVEEIVDKKEAVPTFVFSNFALLSLQMLPSLKSLYPKVHISEWPILEVMKVYGCDNVEIFASEFLSIQGTYGENQQPLFLVCKDAFPRLEELELCEMPRLLHLWRGNSQPSNACQNLKTLRVSGCGSLENSWSSSVSFQNLETLQVSKCDGLRYLLTPLKAKTLDQLTRMNVSDCKMMGEIITRMGDEVLQDPIVFNRLNYLELDCLSSLKSFCCGDYTLEFPSLKKVIVRQCLKMETFCHGVISTPELERLQWTGGEDEVEECWEGNLNSTVQHWLKNMNVQSSKED